MKRNLIFFLFCLVVNPEIVSAGQIAPPMNPQICDQGGVLTWSTKDMGKSAGGDFSAGHAECVFAKRSFPKNHAPIYSGSCRSETDADGIVTSFWDNPQGGVAKGGVITYHESVVGHIPDHDGTGQSVRESHIVCLATVDGLYSENAFTPW